MHELSLAESVLEIVEATARREGAVRVQRIRMAVGTLAHVEPEALRFCFDAVARSTCAEGAELILEPVPAEGRCPACQAWVTLGDALAECPVCGACPVPASTGTRLQVRDIELIDG